LRAALILFLLAFAPVAWVFPAMAQPVPATCDTKVKAAMDARAWMGGKRDMETAQSIIVRNPNDSILEMSCFDRNIDQFARQNGSLFSDGHTRFVGTGAQHATLFRRPPLCFGPGCACYGSLTGCSWPFDPQMPMDDHQPTFFPLLPGPNPPGGAYTNQSLDNAFTNLVRRSLRNHLYPNFRTAAPPAAPTTICASMSGLFNTAKCTDDNKNLWITLQAHVGTDRRPTAYGACNDRGKWNTQYTNGNPPAVPRYPAAPPATVGGLDQTLTYRTTIYPANCNTVRPVRTGLLIKTAPTTYMPDAVCPGVNCYYNFSTNTCNN
jgi:hypothetical protein